MESKPVMSKVHPDFRKLLFRIQNDRITAKMESSKDKKSLWRLTKTITNMIESNFDMYESLVNVEIKD